MPRAIHLKNQTFDLSRSTRMSLESQFWMLPRGQMSKGAVLIDCFCRGKVELFANEKATPFINISDFSLESLSIDVVGRVLRIDD